MTRRRIPRQEYTAYAATVLQSGEIAWDFGNALRMGDDVTLGGRIQHMGDLDFADISDNTLASRIVLVGGATYGTMIRDDTLNDGNVASYPLAIAKSRNGIFYRRDPNDLWLHQFGAPLNGTDNDAPAFNAALAYMSAFGGRKLNLDARPIVIGSQVFIGDFAPWIAGQSFVEGPNWSLSGGTRMKVNGSGFTPFRITGTQARGARVSDIIFYQDHPPLSGPTWSPTVYDPVFDLVDMFGGMTFESCAFVGIYDAIRSRNGGRLKLDWVRGQIFHTLLDIDTAYDVVRIEGGLQLYPYMSAEARYMKWQQDNAVPLLIGRCDGLFVEDVFGFAANKLIRLYDAGNGVCTKFSFGSVYGDFCKTTVSIEGDNIRGHFDYLSCDGQDYGSPGTAYPGSVGILQSGAAPYITIDAFESNYTAGPVIDYSGGAGNIYATSALMLNFGVAAVRFATTGASRTVEFAMLPFIAGAVTTIVNAGGVGTVVLTGARNAVSGGVNTVRLFDSTTGNGPTVAPAGTDTNIQLNLASKGAAPVSIVNPLQLPSVTVATVASTYPPATYPRSLVYLSDGASNKKLAICDGSAWRYPDGTTV